MLETREGGGCFLSLVVDEHPETNAFLSIIINDTTTKRCRSPGRRGVNISSIPYLLPFPFCSSFFSFLLSLPRSSFLSFFLSFSAFYSLLCPAHTFLSILLSRYSYTLTPQPPCGSRPSTPTHISNTRVIMEECFFTNQPTPANMTNPPHRLQRVRNKKEYEDTDEETSEGAPARGMRKRH